MADILIKNMEMPKTCFDCPFLRDDFCIVLGYEMRNDQILRGCGSCPLVEVKPHGRLIDADKLLEELSECEMKTYGYNGSCDDCEDRNICKERILIKRIKDAPTVLEASE